MKHITNNDLSLFETFDLAYPSLIFKNTFISIKESCKRNNR